MFTQRIIWTPRSAYPASRRALTMLFGLIAIQILFVPSAPHAQVAQLESRTVFDTTGLSGAEAVGIYEPFAGGIGSGTRIAFPEYSAVLERAPNREFDRWMPRREFSRDLGVHVETPLAFRGNIAPKLAWEDTRDGRVRTTISLASPGATAFRVQLRVEAASGAQLRYFSLASNGASEFLHEQSLQPSLANESAATTIVWSPTIESDLAGVEVILPNRLGVSGFGITVQRISLQSPAGLANSNVAFSTFGAASICSNHVDAQCSADASVLNKVSAVGRVLVEKDGGPVFCTGTLVNSRDVSPDALTLGDGPAPYLLTSNSCVATQQEADSMEVTWFFQRSICGAETLDYRASTTFGGGDLLATSVGQDQSLIRLRQNLPGGLIYSGWRASPLTVPATATALHHPAGAVKKVSSGEATSLVRSGALADAIQIEWDEGAAENGSEGGGLFVDGYLVGTLSRNESSCDGGVGHAGSFAQFYPSIRGYLQGDHGGDAASATTIGVPASIMETLTPGDSDYFRIELAEAGQLVVYSEGDTDTRATLTSADETDADAEPVAEDDNGGLADNFLLDANVAAGTYILWVRGGSDTASGSYTLRTSRGADGPPTGAPSNVAVRRNAQQLTVTWNAVPSADNTGSPITAYQAVAADSQGASRSCTVPAAVRTCAIVGLQDDMDYSVYVRALNAFGQGPNSASVTAPRISPTVIPTVPPAPEDVGVSLDHSTNTLTVSWDPILEDATIGEVTAYRAEAVAAVTGESVSCETDGAALSCEMSGFSDGVTYSLTVTAENAGGEGEPSPALSVTPVHSSDHTGAVGSAATNVGLASATAGYNGDFINADEEFVRDWDWFRIDVKEHGTLYLWTQGNLNTSASLRTDDADIAFGNELSGGRDAGQGGNFSYWVVVSPGIYYVGVADFHSFFTDDLIQHNGGYMLFVDFVVDDHGHDTGSATRVAVESETPGFLADGDVDWFRIDVTRRGTLYLWTQGDVDTDAWLREQASDADIAFGNVQSRGHSAGEGTNFSYWVVVAPGIHYVGVMPQGRRAGAGFTGSYRLFVNLVVDDHGDNIGSATRVAVNSETAGHLANGDTDWFRIDVTEPGTLRFWTEGDIDTVAALRTAGEDLRPSGNSNGGQGFNFSHSYAASADTYYLSVSGSRVSGREEYTLFVSFAEDSE